MRLHPEFLNGAHNRRMGFSKTASGKHLKADRNAHDARLANRDGWEAMHVYLNLKAIDQQVTSQEEADMAAGIRPHQRRVIDSAS